MPLVLGALLLVGCDKIEGQLNIAKDLTLVNSKGDKHQIKVGTYTADISTNGSKKLTLRFNNDNDEKYNFSIPKGSKLPTNGSFSYKASDIGQAVDLAGTVKTVSTNGPMVQTNQQCTYQQAYQVCSAGPRGPVCTIVYRTVYGNQWVNFYDRTTNQDVTLSILDAGTTTQSAEFAGSVSYIERIVTSQSQCF